MNQFLQDDELLDIILCGTPKSWEREMDKQGFDPFANAINDVIQKLEDIETAEGFDADAVKVTSKKDKKKPKGNGKGNNHNNKKDNNKSSDSNGQKYCMFHGWGNHTSEQCERLKQQIKKLKSGDSDNNTNSSKSGKTGDWKKKADAAKSKAKDNFVTFMNQTVQKAVEEAVKSNKRKSDDESEGSLAAFDKMELADFDYDKMEQMVIEDNGDITV